MCFVNTEKRLVYYHIPKCGGNTVIKTICKFYGFTEISREIHQDYETFFSEDNKRFIDDVRDKHTIREKGKVRYFYTHQDVVQEELNDFFSFTFVRNPYTKLFSAYCYLNRHILSNPYNPTIRGSKEKGEYYVDFKTFIKNYKNVNNIAFFHAFITQYDQLIETEGSIKINFIGRTENLDNDLCQVIRMAGIIIDEEHSRQIFDEEKQNKTNIEKGKRIQDFYDEETFSFVNSFFEKDFEIFGYEKYNSFEEFKKVDLTIAPTTDIYKNCQILKTFLKTNENYSNLINPIFENIVDLLNNNLQNSQVSLLKQQIEFLLEKKRKQEQKYNLQQRIESIELEIVKREPIRCCRRCENEFFNELSWRCHFLTCKV